MCLAVAAKVVRILPDSRAIVDIKGNRLEVNTALVPEVTPEDHVLVHAGFAISLVGQDDYELQHKIFDEIINHAENMLDPEKPQRR